MASLSPEASAIVAAGQSALRAGASDRERIAAALRARLGANVLPLDSPAKPIARSAIHRFVPGATVGACVLGCALFLALRPRPRAVAARTALKSPPAAVMTTVAAATAAVNEDAGVIPLESAAATRALRATPPSSSASRPDQLAQEVPLLMRATSALSAGRPGDALKALNEHQRRFQNGILSEERRAAKARALCSLGRLSEGRAELTRLAPQSPAAVRARQACDSASPPERR